MRGSELSELRKRLGYRQEDLLRELDLGSRQTLSGWENASEVPRLVELATIALESRPDCRRIAGKKGSAKEARSLLRERQP